MDVKTAGAHALCPGIQRPLPAGSEEFLEFLKLEGLVSGP